MTTTTLRFDAPAHHTLKAFGRVLHGGETFEATPEEVRLAKRFRLKLVEVIPLSDPRKRPSLHGSRRQWVQHAERCGVKVTSRMTRDQIIDAVAESEMP